MGKAGKKYKTAGTIMESFPRLHNPYIAQQCEMRSLKDKFERKSHDLLPIYL